MDIEYKSRKLESICTDYAKGCKAYGNKMATKINQRIGEIKSADNIDQMIKFSIGRCHCLKADRKGEFAVDLIHPYRMVFVNKGKALSVVKIISIEDYH